MTTYLTGVVNVYKKNGFKLSVDVPVQGRKMNEWPVEEILERVSETNPGTDVLKSFDQVGGRSSR